MLCISTEYAGTRCPSVHPSVCLSVTFVSCAKTNKDIFKFFLPSGSQAILVFACQTGWQCSDGNPLNGGIDCKGGMKKWWFSTNILLYLRNGCSQMGTLNRETICKHRIICPSIQHLAWLPQGRPQGKQKCGKNSNFGLMHWLKHCITRKLLKLDRYMLRGVWQALNCFSIHETYCMIVAGASPGEIKCGKNSDFWTYALT